MANLVQLYLTNGGIQTLGSLPGERLDINFQGAYLSVGRGNACHLKELMLDVSKIVFLQESGPDVELVLRPISKNQTDTNDDMY